MLAGGNFGIHVADGHRVFAGLCRIVGDEYTRNFKRGEVCVEKFDPRAPSAVVVDYAAVVAHHPLVYA